MVRVLTFYSIRNQYSTVLGHQTSHIIVTELTVTKTK